MEIIINRRVYLDNFHKLFPKEIAVTSVRSAACGTPRLKLCVFEQPCDWNHLSEDCKQKNLEHFRDHGIPWEAGDVPFENHFDTIKKILLKNVRAVYVYGEEEVKYFRTFFKRYVLVKNLEHFGCPDPATLPAIPHEHSEPLHIEGLSAQNCSLEIVGRLKVWYETWWGMWGMGLNRRAPPSLLEIPLEYYELMDPDFLANAAGVTLIDGIWNHLPAHLKADPRIAKYRRCHVHINPNIFGGGSRPFVGQCPQCISGKNKIYVSSEGNILRNVLTREIGSESDSSHTPKLIQKEDVRQNSVRAIQQEECAIKPVESSLTIPPVSKAISPAENAHACTSSENNSVKFSKPSPAVSKISLSGESDPRYSPILIKRRKKNADHNSVGTTEPIECTIVPAESSDTPNLIPEQDAEKNLVKTSEQIESAIIPVESSATITPVYEPISPAGDARECADNGSNCVESVENNSTNILPFDPSEWMDDFDLDSEFFRVPHIEDITKYLSDEDDEMATMDIGDFDEKLFLNL